MNKTINKFLLSGESKMYLTPDLPIALASHLLKTKKEYKNF